ncbi:alpha-L-arabinofuranosidase C-terminal domain-containing protein, partial [Streptomyces sp. NPDC006334]|uniref:alpha-L-arabinofuranosidase C-terminal domain-containing protein n=1 Tax=Streptomyces sp. NPDC006334 TaxID=3156754 RepID=UPI0033B3DAE8
NAFRNGLAEAAFMTGLERNADVVELASYAPLSAVPRAGVQRHPSGLGSQIDSRARRSVGCLARIGGLGVFGRRGPLDVVVGRGPAGQQVQGVLRG